MPLPDVLIKLKNANLKTKTDFDGNFSFNIPKNEIPDKIILIFHYVGYESKEVEIKKTHKKSK